MLNISPSPLLTQLKPWDQKQLRIDQIELTDEFFQNSNGCYRWKNIRGAYFNNFIDIKRVCQLSIKYKEQKEYLWLDGFDKNGSFVKSIFVKMSKRGNDVWRHKVKEKLSIFDELPLIEYPVKTPMLFVTLTFDPKKYSLNKAWIQASKELHLFETKLRNKYGSFVKHTVVEAHESGFPHFHHIYCFHNTKFVYFKHKDKFRIAKKHLNFITKFWDPGLIDVQAVTNTHDAINEVQKYVTKDITSIKAVLSSAMCSLFSKQQYWISSVNYRNIEIKLFKKGWSIDKVTDHVNQNLNKWIKRDFIGSVWGKDAYFYAYKRLSGGLEEPTATTLLNGSMRYCNNEHPEIVIWRYVGSVLFDDLLKFIPNLKAEWLIVADPPPDLEGYLGFLNRMDSLELE